MTVNLYGQCGTTMNYGVEVEIPCDFDFKTYIQDSLEYQENLFIKLVNTQRVREGLPPLQYFKQMEIEVSDVHCQLLVQKNQVYHPTVAKRSYEHYDLVTGVKWMYLDTDIGNDAFMNFLTSTEHCNQLIDPYMKKISVSFLPSKTDTEKTKGTVFVVCTLSP
jgi:uncharacterized protein YkwD